MKALTVRQPWAWQIVHQRKDVENRRTNFVGKYRGAIAIHAAIKQDRPALAMLPSRAPEWVTAPRIFQYGVIVGVVDLVDIHPSNYGHRVVDGCCTSEWADQFSVFHLVLANPRPLKHPIPCKGALGLWTPPSHVCVEAAEQLVTT